MRSLKIQDRIKSEVLTLIASYKGQYEKVIVDPCENGSVNVIGGDSEFSRFHQKMIFVEKRRETISSSKLEELVKEYKSVWGVNLHAFPA